MIPIASIKKPLYSTAAFLYTSEKQRWRRILETNAFKHILTFVEPIYNRVIDKPPGIILTRNCSFSFTEQFFQLTNSYREVAPAIIIGGLLPAPFYIDMGSIE